MTPALLFLKKALQSLPGRMVETTLSLHAAFILAAHLSTRADRGKIFHHGAILLAEFGVLILIAILTDTGRKLVRNLSVQTLAFALLVMPFMTGHAAILTPPLIAGIVIATYAAVIFNHYHARRDGV